MKTKITVVTALTFFLFQMNWAQQTSTNESQENSHRDPTHNFTMQRLIIINENNEMLMCREDYVWANPSGMYSERQFIRESLHSIASTYGIKISEPKLHGQFSYKYDYHPFSTIRNYYVAKYVSGELKVPEGLDEAKWMPIPEAIEKTTVTAIQQSIKQIIDFPDTVWGSSFMVFRQQKGHPTKQIDGFYPLF